MTGVLDQRLGLFHSTLDERTQKLEEGLQTRVAAIINSVAAGGNDVIRSVDQRLSSVSGLIDERASLLVNALNDKVREIDQTLGTRASRLVDVLGEKATEIARRPRKSTARWAPAPTTSPTTSTPASTGSRRC